MAKGPSRHSLKIASLGLLAFAFAALAACKEEPESTFDPQFSNSQPEAPPISDLVPDAGRPESGVAGPTTCEPKIPDPFTPTWNAPQKTAACETADLAGYYDACLTKLGDEEAAKACATWRSSHDACTKCLEPADKSGPIQWHLDRKLMTLNVAGCVTLVQNDLTDAGCGAAFDKAVQCTRQSCDWCIEAGGAYATYQTCQNNARGTGVCQSLETARQSKCAGITGTSGSAKTCWLLQGDTEKDHFLRVQGLFCAK